MPANRKARPGKTPDRSVPKETRSFIVTSHHEVAGKHYGELVEGGLSIAEAEALIASGHIREATEGDIEAARDAANDAEVHIDHIEVVDDGFHDADEELTAGVEPVRPDGEPTTDDVEPVRPEEDEAGDEFTV